MTYGLSKSGEQIIGISQNAALDRAEWELISVDVKTGVERKLASLNLPPTVSLVESFSLTKSRRDPLRHVDLSRALRYLDAGGLRPTQVPARPAAAVIDHLNLAGLAEDL